jgi:hypothetical protein
VQNSRQRSPVRVVVDVAGESTQVVDRSLRLHEERTGRVAHLTARDALSLLLLSNGARQASEQS